MTKLKYVVIIYQIINYINCIKIKYYKKIEWNSIRFLNYIVVAFSISLAGIIVSEIL